MSKLKVIDFSEVVDIDPCDMRAVVGGWFWKTYSTEDLHKSIYGDESPYGRIPVNSKSSTTGYRSPYSFFGF